MDFCISESDRIYSNYGNDNVLVNKFLTFINSAMFINNNVSSRLYNSSFYQKINTFTLNRNFKIGNIFFEEEFFSFLR